MNMKTSMDSAKDDVDVIGDDIKRLDEPMPVEDDAILGAANKIDDIISETFAAAQSVSENVAVETDDNGKPEEILTDAVPLDKSDELSTATMGSAEPMECASGNSMASPKHAMATDEIMLESVSVSEVYFCVWIGG